MGNLSATSKGSVAHSRNSEVGWIICYKESSKILHGSDEFDNILSAWTLNL